MTFTDKKFSMIIYGAPGIGKTTLALSAPDPILIDFDRGVSRVKAYHRKTTIECVNYEEVLEDIKSPEVAQRQTIVIDTGGSFVTYLQNWAMRVNPAQNKNKTGGISRMGFGAVKQEFQRFTNMVRNDMNKNVIYVFHSDEQKDKDGNPQQRILCEGAAKNVVWQPCDFGGYVQMIGSDRVISFSPSQEFFAKGCYGIEGQRIIPNMINESLENNFLTKLFDEAKAAIASDNNAFAAIKEQYENTMKEAGNIIDSVNTIEELNAASASLKSLNYVLTSKKEALSLLFEKANEIGAIWDKAEKTYIKNEEVSGEINA